MAVEPSVPGPRVCMRCGRKFVSPDRDRIRRCARCHKAESNLAPRLVRLADVRGAVSQHQRES